MKKEPIKITSRLSKGLSKKLDLAGEKYIVDSEDLGINNPVIVTRIFHKGQIIFSHKADYKDILNAPDLDERLTELVQSQQNMAVEALKMEKVAQNKTYRDYIKEAEALLKSNNQKEALILLTKALDRCPYNPFIFSYQGYLEAIVNKKYSKGVNACRYAFKLLREQMPFGEEFFLPVLYLNLGRAYLAADKKKEAYASFKKGLDIDVGNNNLLSELRKLGIRSRPSIPFLKRSNPLNKYLGKLSRKLKG